MAVGSIVVGAMQTIQDVILPLAPILIATLPRCAGMVSKKERKHVTGDLAAHHNVSLLP